MNPEIIPKEGRLCPTSNMGCYNPKCSHDNCELSEPFGKRNTDEELLTFVMSENVKLMEENKTLKATIKYLQGLLDNHQ